MNAILTLTLSDGSVAEVEADWLWIADDAPPRYVLSVLYERLDRMLATAAEDEAVNVTRHALPRIKEGT